MPNEFDAFIYLGMVALISLSGVMAPGPLLATTICKGYKDPKAGVKISVGHAIIEAPLIIAIFLGFGTILRSDIVFVVVATVGGVVLLYMGSDLIKSRKTYISDCPSRHSGAMGSGLIMTLANPYWLIWWATAGAALVAGAVTFGWIMLPLFIGVHVGTDLLWYLLVSFSVNRSKSLWAKENHKWLFLSSGAIMLIFGIYFIYSALNIAF
ncbi:MAG: LysE family transporter [Methanomassiliicoccales archaeon]